VASDLNIELVRLDKHQGTPKCEGLRVADSVKIAIALRVIVVDPKRRWTVAQLLKCLERQLADLHPTTGIEVVFSLVVTGIGIQQRNIEDVQ